MNATLEALRRFNIVKAVISSASLEMMSRWKTASPDRVIASVVFPLEGQVPEVATLRQEYQAGRLGAFGEVAAQLAGVSPSDPMFEPYYGLCEELDIPVGVHTGFPPLNVESDVIHISIEEPPWLFSESTCR